MVINQGDIFWLNLPEPRGSEPGYKHPYVVIQNDAFNRSALSTAVLAQLTSNLHLQTSPGNVLLYKGEANLPKKCVVNITQVVTIDKSDLKIKIGTLKADKIREIIAGVNLLFKKVLV